MRNLLVEHTLRLFLTLPFDIRAGGDFEEIAPPPNIPSAGNENTCAIATTITRAGKVSGNGK